MNTTLLILVVVALVGALFLALLFFLLFGGEGKTKGQLQNLINTQRKAGGGLRAASQQKNIYDVAAESEVRRTTTAELTLEKRLKYAQWRIPPVLFRVTEIALGIVLFVVVRSLGFNLVMQTFGFLFGPLFMRWLLNLFMDRRFKAFDRDYPQMLMSLVGLLKTGMNAMSALEAAAEGLEDGSLVQHEIRLMIERLRFGVSEDKSIGSFGEDIYHPEIELFVQALLLSRRVGGNLSNTLDRLAKQVRKRQFFRSSAHAAVGMQRGSIWFILAIMVALEFYIYFTYPIAITGAWEDEVGWQVWQFGIVVILLGMYWIRQVTKIRV